MLRVSRESSAFAWEISQGQNLRQGQLQMQDTNDEMNSDEESLRSLVDFHQRLDDEADEMSSRKYLSPLERVRLKEIKVMRLRARDAISIFKKKVNL